MTLWKWSTDPATNGAADSTCPWPEGMAPAQVNDSARGTMAAIAKYRDDISGQIVTGGTSSAYTVTSNQSFDTLAHLDGAMIVFVPHTDSAADPTLRVDGLGAKPLRGWTGVGLLAGVLKAGTPYASTYNNTSGEFVLLGYYVSPGEIPIGSGIDYWGATAPSDNFAFADGRAISRTGYPTCYARLGTTYGSGDGTTTFNLPDKRGRVSAGFGGASAGRLTSFWSGVDGNALGASGGEEVHTLTQTELPVVTPGGSVTMGAQSLAIPGLNQSGYNVSSSSPGTKLFGTNGGGAGIYAQFPATSASLDITPFGGGGPHNNVQPTIVCNYIIRIA